MWQDDFEAPGTRLPPCALLSLTPSAQAAPLGGSGGNCQPWCGQEARGRCRGWPGIGAHLTLVAISPGLQVHPALGRDSSPAQGPPGHSHPDFPGLPSQI